VQVQAPSFEGNRFQFVSYGIDNELWLLAADGTWAEPILPVGRCEGALHPQFSNTGDRLFFATRRRTGVEIRQLAIDPTPCGENPWDGWALAVASFSRSGGGPASLGTPVVLYEGEGGFFESHALVGDTIWFSHTADGVPFVDDVFRAQANGSGRVNLTMSPATWDEHGQPSPGGRAWAFNSSRSFSWRPPETASTLRLELWASVGGGEPVRLTDYNGTAPSGTRVLASDFAWSPTGREIVTYHADVSASGTSQAIDVLTLDQAY
jgi:hypothetical protein